MKKEMEFVPGKFYSKGYTRDQALASVGRGWLHLIHRIFDEHQKYPHIIIDQVKEKWGGLRVYTSPMHEDFDKFVIGVEHESFHICVECGKDGHLRGDGWYTTLCDEHANGRPIIKP